MKLVMEGTAVLIAVLSIVVASLIYDKLSRPEETQDPCTPEAPVYSTYTYPLG